jgi:hypothetical protein
LWREKSGPFGPLFNCDSLRLSLPAIKREKRGLRFVRRY